MGLLRMAAFYAFFVSFFAIVRLTAQYGWPYGRGHAEGPLNPLVRLRPAIMILSIGIVIVAQLSR